MHLWSSPPGAGGLGGRTGWAPRKRQSSSAPLSSPSSPGRRSLLRGGLQRCHLQPFCADAVIPPCRWKSCDEEACGREEKRDDQEILLTGKIKKGSVSPAGKMFFLSFLLLSFLWMREVFYTYCCSFRIRMYRSFVVSFRPCSEFTWLLWGLHSSSQTRCEVASPQCY